jgi:hypothetical protein
MLTLLSASDPAANVDIQNFTSVKREKEFKKSNDLTSNPQDNREQMSPYEFVST